jgi:hypothetical protein
MKPVCDIGFDDGAALVDGLVERLNGALELVPDFPDDVHPARANTPTASAATAIPAAGRLFALRDGMSSSFQLMVRNGG